MQLPNQSLQPSLTPMSDPTQSQQPQVPDAAVLNAASSSSPDVRAATVTRVTGETNIVCSIALDVRPGIDTQTISVDTGVGFFDHVRPALLFSLCLE